MIVRAIERVGESVRLIDQTQLPARLVYKELGDYRAVIESIRRLEIRGAPALGIAAAYALALGAAKSGENPIANIRRVADEIKSARPTAANLTWAVDRALARLEAEAPATAEQAARLLWSEAEAIHEEDRRMCAAIGRHGAELIADGARVLTHCNTGALATGGIGTALGVIYTCRDQRKRVHVYADETRPLLQGSRLTAWELQQENIPVTLICDNAAATLMAQGKIDCVLVGADRIARNGDTANKIGTYGLAVLAEAHRIPFYVAAPSSTFDLSIATGAEIPIEQRSPGEVWLVGGQAIAPAGINAANPAFDVTPGRLVTYFVTESGLLPGGRSR